MNARTLLVTGMGVAVAVATVLVPRTAGACGGFYANDVAVDPSQKIILLERDGVETYVFKPHFCGAAKDFGIILPIPAALATNPTLADNALFEQLDAYTAPEIVEECPPEGGACSKAAGGAADNGSGEGDTRSFDPGVNVIDGGRVGIFEYVLVQATSVNAFTDWLEQNGFSHGDTSNTPFGYYVDKQWYFVAFKVSAAADAPPAGQKLCGELGPIQLSFPSANLVIPARITAVNAYNRAPVWRVFAFAPATKQFNPVDPTARNNLYAQLFFAGTLQASRLGSYGSIASIARDGERLTVLDVTLAGTPTEDIALSNESYAVEFRTQLHRYKDCSGSGCSTGSGMTTSLFGAAAVLAFLNAARRPARRRSACE